MSAVAPLGGTCGWAEAGARPGPVERVAVWQTGSGRSAGRPPVDPQEAAAGTAACRGAPTMAAPAIMACVMIQVQASRLASRVTRGVPQNGSGYLRVARRRGAAGNCRAGIERSLRAQGPSAGAAPRRAGGASAQQLVALRDARRWLPGGGAPRVAAAAAPSHHPAP
ncbi:hypothetical protein MNEG_16329 [Monoraphidium neglectum]|jgi:hypothetical protein|uniref:Uncharacterized protein n=1 Tax=Monoraphidium neglectum TaxID=145388 RepID=A0A0D2LNU1_9CHLO|nr:hypothetical protein MNEG_16329 [Monoraphidium neglectum]KIY91636.1 hypothetical protein MNEG_16329 [Monoraphidium neglectum]|eukprot:XP_013890656.1 hypothetical protein MNEG_16329 [Monoraphidium neglectum]